MITSVTNSSEEVWTVSLWTAFQRQLFLQHHHEPPKSGLIYRLYFFFWKMINNMSYYEINKYDQDCSFQLHCAHKLFFVEMLVYNQMNRLNIQPVLANEMIQTFLECHDLFLPTSNSWNLCIFKNWLINRIDSSSSLVSDAKKQPYSGKCRVLCCLWLGHWHL